METFGWFHSLFEKRPANKQDGNPLAGKPLRYLIGADNKVEQGVEGEITEVNYGGWPARKGVSIAYCNLFDEYNSGRLGPYLKSSDTAKEYAEGQIDPRGPGWAKNLNEQFERRKRQGFEFIELDNPDAYDINDVIGAIDLAASRGLKVVAKNPFNFGKWDHCCDYVQHSNIFGAIVENGETDPDDMDELRRASSKRDLPVWFVAFNDSEGGMEWARKCAETIKTKGYREMRVTYSSRGEYGNSIDIGG